MSWDFENGKDDNFVNSYGRLQDGVLHISETKDDRFFLKLRHRVLRKKVP